MNRRVEIIYSELYYFIFDYTIALEVCIKLHCNKLYCNVVLYV